MIPLVGKVGMEGPCPIMRDFLEADDRRSFDFFVDFLQNDREAVLWTEMVWI